MRSLLLVAIETHLRLCRGYEDRILSRMARVTVCASDLVDVMIVAVPAESCVRRMAIHAHTVLGIDRSRGVRSEHGTRKGALFAAPYPSCMIARWSVAGFTLQLAMTKRPVRIIRVRMCTLEHREDDIFLVTRET